MADLRRIRVAAGIDRGSIRGRGRCPLGMRDGAGRPGPGSGVPRPPAPRRGADLALAAVAPGRSQRLCEPLVMAIGGERGLETGDKLWDESTG